ncbi:transglutaminase-like domain-containing protein [Microbulbifer bruguierae]|uniref:Transglutaminase-like domain-containing protein n=1 Tax=Microbulbifer bruguierae TaxID=3029061 RepID=A0ABY8NBK2_9GAMM|nr:transglutaminase-like domain-containing protein [Microbulbifer bruguierae]WGL16306.1 transglutaminase-like domain-containing protein [Microbulbifer bruguierae]
MHNPRSPVKTLIALTIFSMGATALSPPIFAADLSEIRQKVDQGHYQLARAEIEALLQQGSSNQRMETVGNDTEDRSSTTDNLALAFEAERMRRIEMEFTIKPEALLASIQRYIPDASEADIQSWNAAGLLEYKIINGERRYFNKAAYNLVHISDTAAKRSNDYRRFTDKAPLYRLHPHHSAVIGAETPLRQRIEVEYTLTVDADAVPAGETLRAWLPFPQQREGLQENVSLLTSTPETHRLAPATQPQRTIYLEKTAQQGEPTEFRVRYAYDSLSRYTAIDAEKVQPTSVPEVAEFLSERAPHIQFTPALKALSERIVGDERNPYRIAQKLFAHVDQIPWAGAREYSTIRNISAYAAEAGHADCGQQTLLLITLLRMNGIPARWQSGWEFSPEGFDTMHDWGEIYLAPYGWLPMDVTHGLLDSEKEAERWFYLGGIDSYRLIFNSDYSRPFVPAKQHFRSETVDSQRGEVEWRGGNLYFDQWDYDMQWKLVEPQQNAQR